MSGKPILYSNWRSSCSWRVRAALALLDIDYDYRAVNLLKSEQKSESYLLMNPTGTVPTLVIPEDTKLVLCDSIAIMHYLHEVTPGSKLLPSDPGGRAKVREICNIIASGTQPVQNLKACIFGFGFLCCKSLNKRFALSDAVCLISTQKYP